ncbi:MAG: RagB/SusD family nutrient uptake outer membrane protein, partial [Cyclobacteriaceae bacterium]|nr:RagB/SusD family nutrient uptake outer membrane protein [Cyclobacteriaceae bacterium HetDA_MAG_MS6]
MKRLTKAFILPMVLGSIVIAACTDDFLDTTNSETLSSGNFPTRIEDVDLLVNDIYGRLRNGFFDAYPQSRIGYGASHYADQAFSDNNFDAGAQINFDPNNSDVQEMWDKHYENISRANGALDAIERLRATDDLTSDVQTTLDRREGEVRFIRALNYFYLINFFGESFITQPSDADKPGVPIIEKVATTLAETRVEKSTVGQVWAYIKADLNAAATLLDDVVWDGNDVARVNEWAIKGFLGKAHVFTQDWADAVTVLRDVIDNSGRTLVAYDIYANMFNNQNTFNNESLFELNFNDQQVNTDWSNTSNANTYFPILISPSFINSGGGLDCNGFCNFIVHDRSLLRFGWTDTTRNDYNRADYFALAQNIRDNQLADPRLWVSAQQPFVDSITVNDELVAIAKNRGEGIQAVIGSLYGWSFRKLTLTNRGIWA